MNKNSKYYKEARKKVLEKRKPYQKKRVIIPVITAVIFFFLGIFGIIYSSFYQSTDDAFVEAHMIYLAPKVSGQIVELNVDDNDFVKGGEIIAQIDPADYQVALDSAKAKLEKAQAELKVSVSDIDKMGAMTKQTQNNIDSAKSTLEYANSDYVRYKNAYKDGSVTKQDLDNAIKNLDVAKAQFKAAQEQLKATNSALNSTISKKSSQIAEIKRLMADVEQAKLNLSYTTIIAPKDGTITNKNVEIGTYAQKAHPIVTIVPKDCYIVANFKETQLTHMKKGQKVKIKIDTYGSKTFDGVVDSIQRASGAKASLFPPENAVGSYVKVVQRVPVKIVFTEDISITPLTISVVPAISAARALRHKRDVSRIAENSMRIAVVLALPMGVGLSVLAGPIMATVYPDSHSSGGVLLTIMGAASFFVCMALMMNSVLQAGGNEKYPIYSMIAGGVVKIAVNWFLVADPEINIVGAPIGTLACYAVMCVMNFVFLCRRLPEKPSLGRILLRPAIASAVMGAAAWAVYGLAHSLLGEGYMHVALAMLCAIGVAVLVYLVLVIALRAVTLEDMRLIPKGEKLARILHIK